MPQREFWAERHPVRWDATYYSDPVEPGAACSVTLMVRDQAHEIMDTAYITLPAAVVDEAVPEVLRAAWEAYLYGEVGAMSSAIAPIVKAWRDEASRRSG